MDNSFSAEVLRPTTLAEFGGQKQVVSELSIVLKAAIQRKSLPDHMLFSGPPGTGKTTLAGIVANECKLEFIPITGPSIKTPDELRAILTRIREPSVLFIDEIHGLNSAVEESLYSAMEDGVLDLIVGEGVNARTLRITLKPFVLIGATTQLGKLSSPFRDRFGFAPRIRPYSVEELAKIVARSANILEMNVTEEGCTEIASRSRQTPRVANAWLRRVRDWVDIEGITTCNKEDVINALNAFGVDILGLDHLGQEFLRVLCTTFDGGPVGGSTWAQAVNESIGTLEDMYEPYFVSQGLVLRTPRGRVATELAYTHLNLQK